MAAAAAAAAAGRPRYPPGAERWPCFYPCYMDSSKRVSEGRKLPRSKLVGCEGVTMHDLMEAAAKLGLTGLGEVRALFGWCIELLMIASVDDFCTGGGPGSPRPTPVTRSTWVGCECKSPIRMGRLRTRRCIRVRRSWRLSRRRSRHLKTVCDDRR